MERSCSCPVLDVNMSSGPFRFEPGLLPFAVYILRIGFVP